MNKSFKSAAFGRAVLLVLLSLAVIVVEVLLFVLVQKINLPHEDDIVVLCVVAAAVLCVVAFVVINNVRLKKVTKKYNDKTQLAKNIDEANSKYLEAQADYLAAENVVVKKKNKIVLHKALLSTYFASISLVCALGAQEGSDLSNLFVVVGVIFMFLSPLCWIDLLTLFEEASEYNIKALSESAYPELYKVVAEAKNTLGCHKPFKIYPVYNSGISVSSSTSEIQIHLDCEETSLLTRDELYNVMLHEIAHVVNSDTKRSRSLEHFSYASTHFGHFVTYLFFSSEFVDFTIKKTFYYLACTRFYEQSADEAVKKYGNGQAYINGTAKAMLFDLFRNCNKPEVDFRIFENETMPSDYFVTHLEQFKQYLSKNFERWDFVLRNRIQSRQDSHPTFAMRLKFLGVEDYDYTTVQPQGDFADEQHKLLLLGCTMLLEDIKTQFKYIREQQYLPDKKKLEDYRKLSAEGKIVSVQQKTEYLSLLFTWDRDECLKLCDEVLAEFPKNSYACYFKGLILADLLDKDCVDLLYTAAAENFNLTENAIQTVGEFACNVGDEELLQRYRDRATSDIVSKEERLDKYTTHVGDRFSEQRLSKDVFDEILQYILSVNNGSLKSVFAVSRGEGDEMLTTFLLEWHRNAKYEKKVEVSDSVFSFLDRYGDGVIDYNFELRSVTEGADGRGDNAKIIQEIMRTDGALVYSDKKNSK